MCRYIVELAIDHANIDIVCKRRTVGRLDHAVASEKRRDSCLQ